MEVFRAVVGTSCAAAIAVINATGELILCELLPLTLASWLRFLTCIAVVPCSIPALTACWIGF